MKYQEGDEVEYYARSGTYTGTIASDQGSVVFIRNRFGGVIQRPKSMVKPAKQDERLKVFEEFFAKELD